MIQVQNLNYASGNINILSDINTTIQKDSMTAIIGPNGAGKTSFLKCLSGAKTSYQGTIKYENKNIKDFSLSELAKKRSVMSQANPISFPFTAFEIVMMGRNPYISKTSVKQDNEISSYLLNLVEAYQFKDRLFPSLSGGEQQRVQLARVLAQIWDIKNSIIFLDEPTSALDLKHQHHVLDLVRDLAIEKSVTIVCILHDLRLVQHYTENVILMSEGNIKASGKTSSVLTTENLSEVYKLPVKILEKFHMNF